MDFFALQEKARQRTWRLIGLFILSVALIVAALNLAAYAILLCHYSIQRGPQIVTKRVEYFGERAAAVGVLRALTEDGYQEPDAPACLTHAGKARFRVWVSLTVVLFIGLMSAYRVIQLARQDGNSIAVGLGGVPVDRTTEQADCRRLVNVAEEMAIAAGIGVPGLYVLERETGINAMAAGWGHDDAAIMVSRGALEELSRDELQGVVAHECSHILSGDMRLNIRMMGVLYGIVCISELGEAGLTLARAFTFEDERGQLGGAPVLSFLCLLIGAPLVAIGSVGALCGLFIRAGVSRQREFLADAEAVQLTRNPDGLAGALKKIGGFTKGSRMDMTRRGEVSHMFFASGQQFWLDLLATHPPLEERIRAIESNFADDAPAAQSPTDLAGFAPVGMVYLRETSLANQNVVAWAAQATGGRSIRIDPDALAEIPRSLLDDAEGCEPALLAALLRSCGKMRKRSARVESGDTEALRDIVGEAMYAEMRRLLPTTRALPPEHILPLAGMTLPRLCALPKGERTRIVHLLDRLAAMDGELALAEYCLTRMARLYLDVERQTAHSIQSRPAAAQLRRALVALFTVMAWSGGTDKNAAQAFAAGIASLLPKTTLVYEPIEDWVAALDQALELMATLPAISRKQILAALVVTVGHDGGVCLEEAELLRLVCASLQLPIPSCNTGPGSPLHLAA